jgi:hypothetical protein
MGDGEPLDGGQARKLVAAQLDAADDIYGIATPYRGRRRRPMMCAMPGSGSNKIDDYFLLIQKDSENRFSRSRQQNTDTEAKGVAAERMVGQIIEPYLQPSRPTYRRQIIDSRGESSDEMDLIFCNWAQPSVETELLLTEGVDYAIQVKSRLTKREINRFVKNAASVKKLRRYLGKGETAVASDLAGSRFVDRVPCFGFALESELSFASAHAYMVEAVAGVEGDLQPDALFIMGRGAMVNSRMMFTYRGQAVPGWIGLPFPDKVLVEFVNYAIAHVPRIVRNGTALKAVPSEGGQLAVAGLVRPARRSRSSVPRGQLSRSACRHRPPGRPTTTTVIA